MRVKIDGFVEEMKQLAESIPKKANDDVELSGTLNPLPNYHIFDPFSNTAVLMREQMVDVMNVWRAGDDELDLHPSFGLTRTLNDSYLSEVAEEGWREELGACLDVRYIVAIRTLKYIPPKIVDKKKFSGGAAAMMVALYDRQSKEWLYAGPVIALSPKRIEYTAKAHEIDATAISNVKKDNRNRIRKQIDEKLTKLTGGFFEFEPNKPKRDGSSAMP